MYSIDGVALANPALGWRLDRASEPKVARSFTRTDFNGAGRDGTVSVRGYTPTPTVTLVVRAPDSTVEQLTQLLMLGRTLTKTATPGMVLGIELMTLTPVTVAVAGGGVTAITAVFRVPGVYWRDAATTDWTATLPYSGTGHSAPGSANMAVLSASTAPVRDALILVTGTANNLKIAGQNGTWVSFTADTPSTGSGGGLLIDAARGRCWTNPSNDLWGEAGANDSTGSLNTGAYPYFLELAPSSTAPGATLALSWSYTTEAVHVTVRAKNAYNR